jgi:hypothetical protein
MDYKAIIKEEGNILVSFSINKQETSSKPKGYILKEFEDISTATSYFSQNNVDLSLFELTYVPNIKKIKERVSNRKA